jgi:3-isopropylmalate dehydrogenase
MVKTIAVLAGDGIGPEVMQQGLRVLTQVGELYDQPFNCRKAAIGGAAFDVYATHCPRETLAICEQADAILFGSVGGPVNEQQLPKWDQCETNSILALRKHFSFNVNFRPIRIYSALIANSPLQASRISNGADLLILRELCGDIYFGKHELRTQGTIEVAVDEAVYDTGQITAIAHAAFQAARLRKKQVVSVDKANVLATSKLWRKVVEQVHVNYPEVSLTHMLVDNCAMQLVLAPSQFDVLLTPNMFGDILSDLAAALPGSLGLVPSASFNAQGMGLYEPSGGSAPDLVGQNIANPCAQILSVAMMLRHSFAMNEAASLIEAAIEQTLAAGVMTRDIAGGKSYVTTEAFTDKLVQQMKHLWSSREFVA